MHTNRPRFSAVHAVGLAFLLIGAVVFAILFFALRDASRTADWPTVRGVVLSSTVERQVNYDDDGEDAGEVESILFAPIVKYRYAVGGVVREGSRVDAFGTSSSDEAWARGVAARYVPGAPVTVYHSSDGRDAVLEPGLAPGAWAWLALPGAFILVGLALQFVGATALGTRRSLSVSRTLR